MFIFSFIRSKWLSLMIELSRSRDHLYRRLTGKPRAKRSLITPEVFLGGQYKQAGLTTLKAWGITAVVSMRMKKPVIFQSTEWLSVLHLPTIDQTAPSLAQLKQGVDFIKKQVDAGGKVYIHCHHGEGRGPTMTAAYLISTGISLDDALDQIRKVRTFIRPTLSQLERLKEYEALIQAQQLT